MSFHRLIVFVLFIEFYLLTNNSINCLNLSQTLTQTFDEFINEKDFETILGSFNGRFIIINNCFNKLIAENPFCRVSYYYNKGNKILHLFLFIIRVIEFKNIFKQQLI